MKKILPSLIIVTVFVLGTLFVLALSKKNIITTPSPTPTPTKAQMTPAISKTPTKQTANPASENCVKKGGILTMQTRGDGGAYGLCDFGDNMYCEEWALLQGKCPVGGIKTTGFNQIEQKYCAWIGGKTTSTPGASCILPSEKVCKNAALYLGSCSVAE